jgi:hypothetical protein
MRCRTVLQEFEAHLHPVQPGSNVHGKSEWKHYGDGTDRFKISLRELSLPDNSDIDLWRDGQWMMRLSVKDSRAKLDIENDNGSGIPTIKAGQVFQVKSGETVLAEGKYEVE